jgi:osmotically-inducible protein OsmY
MKSMIWSAGLIALLFAGPVGARSANGSPATAHRASTTSAEERIEHRVKHDKALRKYHIGVSVKDQVATLTGTVATEAQRRRAGELANVSGIRHVDNDIVVNHSEVTGTTGRAESTGSKTKEEISKTGEVMTDAWVTTRVKSHFFGEHLLKNSDINVDTDDHVVTLRGTVPTEAARARAVELAERTEGVHRVVDHLTIGPKR